MVVMALCGVCVAILATKDALERPMQQMAGKKVWKKDVKAWNKDAKADVKAWRKDTKAWVKPVERVATGKVALSETRYAALERIQRKEDAQSADHGLAIEQALKMHSLGVTANVHTRLAARRRPDSELQAEQLAAKPPRKEDDYHDHPWDLANPEGMPMPDGSMESAAAMYARAGAAQPPATKPKNERLQADAVMAGGGSEDPRALLDLSQGLEQHEAQPQRVKSSQPVWGIPAAAPAPAARPQQQEGVQDPQRRVQQSVEGGVAKVKGSGPQGFVTGDHLRVSAKEYHREMETYMPSADGRLLSPFQWFKSMGKPAAPAPKPKPAY